jgi:hypothetical protein
MSFTVSSLFIILAKCCGSPLLTMGKNRGRIVTEMRRLDVGEAPHRGDFELGTLSLPHFRVRINSIKMTQQLYVVVVAGLVCCWGGTAWAQNNELAQARASYESAQFEDCLESLERALNGTDLSRDELVSLLELQAFSLFALRQDFESPLQRLAVVAPDHSMGPAAPPGLRSAWASIQPNPPPLTVDIAVHEVEGGLRLEAQLEADGAGLARALRLMVREQETWETYEEEATVTSSDALSVAYYAVVVGPGGVELASHGTADTPFTAEADTAEAEYVSPPTSEQTRRPWWPWLAAAGGAVAVAGAIVAVVLLVPRTQSDHVTLEGPVF